MVDPYDWLGVPKGPRPPTHYQLLGLDPSATDPVAIRAAADRQTRRLLPHLTGPDALAAEQAWAELEEARDTLLDPARRAHYDATVPLPSPATTPAVRWRPPRRTFRRSRSRPRRPPPRPAVVEGPSGTGRRRPGPVVEAAAPRRTRSRVRRGDRRSYHDRPPPGRPGQPARSTHDLVPEPRRPRRRTNPVLVGFLGLAVAGLIGGGMYFAFGRKHNPPAPKVEPGPDLARTDPKPAADQRPAEGRRAGGRRTSRSRRTSPTGSAPGRSSATPGRSTGRPSRGPGRGSPPPGPTARSACGP